MDKFVEGYWKDQVRIAVKTAQASENFKEAIEELKAKKELVPVELTEQHAKIDSAVESITSKLEEKLMNSRKLVEEKETN